MIYAKYSIFTLNCRESRPIAYITNSDSDSASVIDTITNQVVGTISVGSKPTGVAINSSGTRIYITNAGDDTVSVIDTSKNKVDTIKVGNNPYGIAIDLSGIRVYVVNSCSGTMSVIDPRSNVSLHNIIVSAGTPHLCKNLHRLDFRK